MATDSATRPVDTRRIARAAAQDAPAEVAGALTHDGTVLETRIAQLEENERRQAELINQMAEQLAALTRLVTVLHQRVMWLAAGLGVVLILTVVALLATK